MKRLAMFQSLLKYRIHSDQISKLKRNEQAKVRRHKKPFVNTR